MKCSIPIARPAQWDAAHPEQDGTWIGTAGAGLQYALAGSSWNNVGKNGDNSRSARDNGGKARDNGGKGGIAIGIKGKSMLAHNYSGARSMKTGDVGWYNFNLLITTLHQDTYQK